MDERRAFRSFVADIVRDCSAHRVQELAAALAFYGALSVAPLLVVVTYLAGNFFGQYAVQGELLARLQSHLGDRVAQLLVRAVANARPRPGHYPALIGGAVALVSAAGLFQQVRTALRRIWGVPDEEGLRGFLHRKGFAFVEVFFFALFVGVLLGAYAVLSAFFVLGSAAAVVAEEAFSLLVLGGTFMLVYRLLAGVSVPWGAAAVGGGVAATLFLAGRFLLTWYFARAAAFSVYAAVGSLMALLLWISFSAQVFLLGAEVTHRIGERPRRGSLEGRKASR
jgi:membrane protein